MTIGGALEKAVAGRWIAGADIGDAVEAARKLNSSKVTAMINYLGEDFRKEEDVTETLKTYNTLISRASKLKLKASIAIKPTQIGLLVDKDEAGANYSSILSIARKQKIFVWLDMEQHQYVDDTISLYLGQAKKGGAGICIQSYLRRSAADVKELVNKDATIRLVKGAYKEKASIAYPSRAETTRNYISIMGYLFKNSRRFMLATHDRGIIRRALELEEGSGASVSFGMLNGIMNSYAYELARNHDVSIYLPFGGRWVSYGYRRMKELENSKLILRSLLTSQY